VARDDLLRKQLTVLQCCHPDAELDLGTDGLYVVTVPMPLPSGWNCEETRVSFLVPHAYPAAHPDCFSADLELRLAGGAMPANSGIQPLAGDPRLWFSWHLQQPWNPAQHSLLTYVRFIAERLSGAS